MVSCAQLATVPVLGRCPAGATTAAFPEDGFAGPVDGTLVSATEETIAALWGEFLGREAFDADPALKLVRPT